MTRACGVALAVAWILALPTAAGVSTVRAQNPPESPARDVPGSAAPSPAARIVRIDAVVTDRKGTPVLNLRAGDFEVVENGVVQRVDAVELRGGAAPASGSQPFPIGSDADEFRAAREPGTRVIALLLDEFHVSPGQSTERVRTAMRQFMDEFVKPADLLLVLKPLESVTRLHFTRDHQAIRDGIETFEGRGGNYEARTPFERQYLGSAPEAVRAGRAQIVMSGLRALMMKLGELQSDRSAIVLASEGFAPDATPRDRGRRVPDVQGLVRAANRFNVAIYAVDPSPAGAVREDGSDGAKTVLRSLTTATGGGAVTGDGDLRSTLARVSHDLDAYYLLTYTSSHPSDGRFYEILVRAKRPDVHVRTRSGYWAPLRTELTRASIASTMRSAPLRALRRSPLIDTWTGFVIDAAGTHHVVFTWEPTAMAGRRRGINEPSTVELKVSTLSGSSVFEGALVQARGTAGVDTLNRAAFEAQAGRLQFDLVILRQDGTRVDTAALDMDVPDAAKPDPRILPPQVFRAASAREFRDLVADADAAPVPGREFRRTERLLLRISTWSPSGVEVKLTATVVNRIGQALRTLEPTGPTSENVRQYDLPLAWLAPGEYRVELTATTVTATAREAIRFRVTG